MGGLQRGVKSRGMSKREGERAAAAAHLFAQLNVLGHKGVGGGLGEARGHLGAAEFQVALEEGLLPFLILLPLVALRRCPVHLQHVPAPNHDQHYSSCLNLFRRCMGPSVASGNQRVGSWTL